MPEKDGGEEIQHTGHYDDQPEYGGTEIPAEPINVPQDIPQEHLPQPPMTSSPVEHAPKPEIIKRLAFLLVAIIIIAILAFAGWKLLSHKNSSSGSGQSTSNSNGQTPTDVSMVDPVALALGGSDLTKTYSSAFLQMQLKYPDSWTVSEQGGEVLVKSPEFDIADNSGVNSKTYFKVYIKQSTEGSDSKYLGEGVALEPSQKISYSEPGANQRKNTFLTNFGLNTPDSFAYFVIEGGFNLKKGDTLGPSFASEQEAVLIAGGFATDQQTDNLQTRLMPLNNYQQNLAYKTGLEIAKSIQFN